MKIFEQLTDTMVIGGAAAAGVGTYFFVADPLAQAIPLPGVSMDIKKIAISVAAGGIAYFVLNGMLTKQKAQAARR